MLNIVHYYCHTRTYLASDRVIRAGPIVSVVPAQFLVVAHAAVVLALLHALGLDGLPLSLDSGCRNGSGEEGGKDECELHVDGNGYARLLELWLLWHRSWMRAEILAEEMEKGRGNRGLYICLTSYNLELIPYVHSLNIDLSGGYKLICMKTCMTGILPGRHPIRDPLAVMGTNHSCPRLV